MPLLSPSGQSGKTVLTAAAVILAVAALAAIGWLVLQKAPVDNTAPVAESTDVEGETDTSQPVAIINGQKLSRQEYDDMLSTLPDPIKTMPAEQLFPLVQEQMVTSALILQKARLAGTDKTSKFQQQRQQAEEQVLRMVYLDSVIEQQVTDDVLRAEYAKIAAKSAGEEEIKARHILVETEDAAKALIVQLGEGADFAKLADDNSKDKSAQGGDLGYFTAGMMVPEFSAAAFAMKPGDVSAAPVKTTFGWHVIKVEDRRAKQAPAFDEMKPMLEADLRRRLLDDLIAKIRQESTIQLFDLSGKEMSAETLIQSTLPAEQAAEDAPSETPAGTPVETPVETAPAAPAPETGASETAPAPSTTP